MHLHLLTISGEELGAKAVLMKVVTGEVEILASSIAEAACEQLGSFFLFESNLALAAGRFPHHLFLRLKL